MCCIFRSTLPDGRKGKGFSQRDRPGPHAADVNKGGTLYRTSCHQSNGEGVPGAFPALGGDPVVTDEDPIRLTEVILFGMEGETIEGVEYSVIMPPFAEQLSDEEVAAIVSHKRTSWGNDVSIVSVEEVEKVRNKGN
ncbi:cytochrome c [Fodinibius sp.]|uniref:c-type cytochrome n=1 Tax=Fodinibius sp. TaxID=1872440 RepID=UPI003561CB13